MLSSSAAARGFARLWSALHPRHARQRTSSAALWSVGLVGAGAVVSFGSQVLSARVLGREQFGTYSYVLGWLNVLQVLAGLELSMTAYRFMGAYRGRQEWHLLDGFVVWSRRTTTRLSVALGAGGMLVVLALQTRLPAGAMIPLLVGLATLPLFTLTLLEGGLLQGIEHPIESKLPFSVFRPLLFIALLLGWWLLRGKAGMSALSAVCATAGALAISLGISRRWFKAICDRIRPALSSTDGSGSASLPSKEWLSYALTVMTVSVSMLVLSQNADVALVGSFVSTTEAGAYAVASQLAAIITLPLAAMLQSVSPRLSALSATGDIEGLRRLTQRTAQLTVVIALPILLVLLVGGRWILTLYGSSYRAAYPVLAILALGQLLGGMGGLGGFLLNMTGQQRKAAPVIMLSAAVNLMFTFLLIPRYGSVGAASATCIGLTLRTILVIAVSRRVTGVLPVPWRVSKP